MDCVARCAVSKRSSGVSDSIQRISVRSTPASLYGGSS
jgi:hypothetical protein